MARNKTRLYVGAAVFVSVLVLFISLMATSWVKLDATEVGVAYDIHQKILSSEVKRSGLHNGSPGFKFIKFPSVFKSLDFPAVECLNKEGIEIVLNVQLQYRARSKDLREIILQFENHDNYVKLLRSNGEAVIRQACSSFNTAEFQAQRPDFQVLVRHTMVQRFDSVCQAEVNDVQVKDIQRPGKYEEVMRNKEVAKENIKIVQNERTRQLIEAKAITETAKIQGKIAIEKAKSEAKVMTSEALGEAERLTKELELEEYIYKKHSALQTLWSHMVTQVIMKANNTVNIALDSPVQLTKG